MLSARKCQQLQRGTENGGRRKRTNLVDVRKLPEKVSTLSNESSFLTSKSLQSIGTGSTSDIPVDSLEVLRRVVKMETVSRCKNERNESS